MCIVTGGARGIGRAIATMLGATGAKVQSIALACAFPVRLVNNKVVAWCTAHRTAAGQQTMHSACSVNCDCPTDPWL